MRRVFLIIIFFIASLSHLYAKETYVAPQANKIMFHVDRLPIDAGDRRELSKSLTILAKRDHDGSLREHRLTAQLLMLSMRLDSKNTLASELNQKLSTGGVLPMSDTQVRVLAIEKVYRLLDVISKTDKLSEARVLGVYLQDVLLGLDSDNPRVIKHEENQDRWIGVLPKYDREVVEEENSKVVIKSNRFNEAVEKANLTAKLDIIGSEGGKEVEDSKKTANIEEEKKEWAKWSKHKSAIATPLTLFDTINNQQVYRREMVTMNTLISPRAKLESVLHLEIKPWVKPDKIEHFKKKIVPLMMKHFGNFESLKVEVTVGGNLSHRNEKLLLLPLYLQLRASQEKLEIKEGMSVLGLLSGEVIKRNPDFWHLLKVIRKSEAANQRLLIPHTAEADLRQLVALEEENFFVKNEVILVSNVSEAFDALALSKSAAVNEASSEFAKIQKMIGIKSVGPFAVNKKVRTKLEEILAKNPSHLSAKMILLRGEVSRPKKLDTYFVADELSTLLGQLSYLNNKNEDSIYSGSLVSLAKNVESTLEELEPFVAADDRDLVSDLNEIADDLGAIARAKDKQGQRESIALDRTITNTFNQFKIKYLEVKTRLDEIMSKSPAI